MLVQDKAEKIPNSPGMTSEEYINENHVKYVVSHLSNDKSS